jgi:L-ascorbate metabolism protein UlaG (beta-lactamase superfamily)
MKKLLFLLLLSPAVATAGDNVFKHDASGLAFFPVRHATMVIRAGGQTVYVDPVGGAEAFKGFEKPTLILVTDIHGDHMDKATIEAVKTGKTRVVAPAAVVEKIGFGDALGNGEKTKEGAVAIEAVPMYNITEGRLERHIKGRGNGYVLTYKGKRVYISGDTEDIPEMRALKDIDIALVCMNLPYTMSVEQAASGVLAFKPKTVLPYHHRGSDVATFKKLVNEGNKKIDVAVLDWYPE